MIRSRTLAAYPDARIVFTHRDPAVALSSLCSLVAYTRALFTDDVDPAALGAELAGGVWPEALLASRPIRERLGARAVDLRHPDLLRDPLGSVERIYAAFGWELGDDARRAMEAATVARRQGVHGRHEHSLEGFGLRREAVRERFAGYCEALDL